MRWQPEVARGAWIAERLDRGSLTATMHSVVPRGFAAYARIFHPLEGRRPVGATWDELRRDPEFWPGGWEQRPTTWRSLAHDLGVTWHPLVQWHSIARASGEDGRWNGIPGPDGWRYGEPLSGGVSAQMLAEIAVVLARHTSTPDVGQAAVWEGHGGLFSNDGISRITFYADDELESEVDEAAFLESPPLGPEVDAGPRLELPARSHVLFDAGIRELADESWPERAPWVRDSWPVTPSLVWPEDRAWVLVGEVDYDSTIVAGSADVVADLLAAPGLEVEEIPEGADLSWDGDRLNG
ncbi:hypothetical protein [Agromyces allii]|uniref:Uncharacterized protein n=1 Tax=Agromyces allii TaxID=393607 RepID=A0ABN2PY07_9MICO|nr:hypothetical protein [Agromyces allii]